MSDIKVKPKQEKTKKGARARPQNGRAPRPISPARTKELFARGPAASLRGPVPEGLTVTKPTAVTKQPAPAPTQPAKPVAPLAEPLKKETAVPPTEPPKPPAPPAPPVAKEKPTAAAADKKNTGKEKPAAASEKQEAGPVKKEGTATGSEKMAVTSETAVATAKTEKPTAAGGGEGQGGGGGTAVIMAVTTSSPIAQTDATAPVATAPVAQAAEQQKEGKPSGEEKKKQEGEGATAVAEGETEEAVAHAPTSPQEDPAFQQTIGHINSARKKQAGHQPPAAKTDEVKQAAILPENEQQTQNDRQQHMETMNQVASTEEKEEQPFKPETFKKLLNDNLANIENSLPQSEAAAKRFKRDKPLEGVRQNINAQVQAENQKVAAPIAGQVRLAEPPASGLPTEAPQELQEEPPGSAPKPISSQAAAPKPKYDAEISMQKESQSLDDKMTAYNMTEEQLANSNEPTFLQALDTKKQAQKEAAAAPGRYREQEEQVLGKARRQAGGAGEQGLGGMFSDRSGVFAQVFAKQGGAETYEETAKRQINKDLEHIYTKTKQDVDQILSKLTESVDSTFSTEVKAAQEEFERQVESQLDDIYGYFTIDDAIFGEDTEAIEAVFEKEKARFLDKMDTTLTSIANRIADDLNAAIKRIKDGRQESQTYYDNLGEKEKTVAKESLDFFTAQYDNLEDSVHETQNELARSLAESYQKNVAELGERFNKIKEEVSKTWLESAGEFLVSVGEAIYKLGALLRSIIDRISVIIDDILAHPIRFLKNLAAGIKSGFQTFGKAIDVYLAKGLFDWLRGSMGGEIHMPESLDVSGMFSLTAQLLDLNYDTFRKIAVSKLGEKSVAALEKGVEVAEKGLELFQLARSKGLGALWEHIKEMMVKQLQTIFDKVKETVLYETIKKALATIAAMFTPVGAFIKAAQTLYRGMRFLVDNIDRIAELVNAFLDSLELAVKGDVGAIAKRVIQALQHFIVIAIDFLAKILGLGKLADKVRHILQALRKPILRAMEWLVDKLKPIVMRVYGAGEAVVGKVKTGVKKGITAVTNWWKIRKGFKQGEETHELYFRGEEDNATLMVESTPQTLAAYVTKLESNGYDKTKTSRVKKLSAEVDALKKEKSTKKQFDKVRQKMAKIANILAELSPQAKRPSSHISFTTQTIRGSTVGQHMVAKPLSIKAGNTTGSQPTQKTPLWNEVRVKKGTYVRGHLLNHHVHGPGQNQNLTPIKKTFNEDMERKVESTVKEKVMGENEVVAYVVDVAYSGHNDPRLSDAEKSLATSITFSLHRMEKKADADGEKPGSWEEKGEIPGIQKSMQHDLP